MIPTFYVTTPYHSEPIVVAGTIDTPTERRAISAVEAMAAAARYLPSLQTQQHHVRRGSPMERRHCDVPRPELFL